MFSTTTDNACEDVCENGCETLCESTCGSETCEGCCNITTIALGTIAGIFTGAIMGITYATAQPEEKRIIVLTAVDTLTKAFNCTVESLPTNLHFLTVKCDSLVIQNEVQNQVKNTVDDELGTSLGEVGKAFGGLITGAFLGGLAGFGLTFFAAKTKDNGFAAAVELIAERREAQIREAMEQGYLANLSVNKRGN